jgi:hypothetical protein
MAAGSRRTSVSGAQSFIVESLVLSIRQLRETTMLRSGQSCSFIDPVNAGKPLLRSIEEPNKAPL